MSQEPHPAPPEVDTSVASIARVYDAGLGGKDNFAADRAVINQLLEIAPELPTGAKAHRRWLRAPGN